MNTTATQMTVERANDLRKRILAGEEISDSEMQEIIQALVAERAQVMEASTTPKKSKKDQPKIDLNDFLDGE